MQVWSVLVTALAAAAVLILPGLPVVLALRLRPLLAAASLAPLSLALIAASAELGHAFSIPWNPGTALLLGLLLGAILWLPGRRLRRSSVPSGPALSQQHRENRPAGDHADADPARPASALTGRTAATVAGLLLGGGLLTAQALRIMGSIDALSQTYDNVFHLNAIRHVLRAGDGSAWVVGGMTRLEGQAGYYPALWHQAASLVVQVSGQDIVLASNVLMLAVVGLVWPLAVVALVRHGTDTGPVGLLMAGALSGISAAMPLTLMGWGILLPYLLSLAMMPLVVLVIAVLAGLAPADAPRIAPLQLAVITPAVLAAVTLSHPQGVFAGIVLGLPILAWAVGAHVVDAVRRHRGALMRAGVAAVLLAVATGATAMTWTRFRPSQASAVWEPNTTRIAAIGQAASLSPNETATWEPLGVLMLVACLAVLLASRSRWLLASWAAASMLSVITRSEPMGAIRYLFTGNWYSDNNRITAIPIVVAVPLLAVGLDRITRLAAARLPWLRGRTAVAVTLAAALALMAMGVLSPSNRASIGYLGTQWQSQELLTDDERELLERLPEVVPEGAVIATNAWNGSSLAYAISDRPVLNTFMGFEAEPDVHLLNARLDEANTDPAVCDAAQELRVDYALDFGPQELHERTATYTGLNEISETGAAEVVLQVGDAKLLRILPCVGADGQLNP